MKAELDCSFLTFFCSKPKVTLTVSSGPGSGKVPGDRRASARKKRPNGWKPRNSKSTSKMLQLRQASKKAQVINSNPSGGSNLTHGSTVVIVVSRGPKLTKVPVLVGSQRRLAVQQIRGRGLTPSVSGEESDSPAGEVISQSPSAGNEVEAGSTVAITVSDGKQQAKVPNVIGKLRSEAVQTMREAGLSPTVEEEETEVTGKVGRAIDQFPPPGSELEPGDEVTIVVGKQARGRTGSEERNEGRGSQRRPLLRARRLAALRHLCRPRPRGGRPRGGGGDDRARRPLAARGRAAAADTRPPACSTPRRSFPALHGAFGEDGSVQGLLELLDVPYVGSDVLASAICMDKLSLKRLFAERGIPQVDFVADGEEGWRERCEAMGLPLWVKPSRMGSSVGISQGRGLGGPRCRGRAGPAPRPAGDRRGARCAAARSSARCSATSRPLTSLPGEIVANAEWYDFEAKYEQGGMELRVPAPAGEEEAAAHAQAGRRDLRPRRLLRPRPLRLLRRARRHRPRQRDQHHARLHQTSVYAKLLEASGIAYADLCDRLVALAVERHRSARSHQF